MRRWATLLILTSLIACGDDPDESVENESKPRGGSSGAAGKGGSAGKAGAAGKGGNGGSGGVQIGGQGGSNACDDGAPCKGADGKAGLCAGGACCKASLACGSVCCGAGQLCSFGKCQSPGAECKDASDCGAGEYCETAALEDAASAGGAGGAGGGAAGAASCSTSKGPEGRCLPLPPTCSAAGAGGASTADCLQPCEVKPPTKPFEVELKYAWGGVVEPPYDTDVMMTPIVIQLDDDDCDGKVTARDIPEIVFTTFTGGKYGEIGTLHAISIVGGKVVDKWSVPGLIAPGGQLAAGNIDGLPGNEVVACGADGFTYAFKGDGTQLWKSADATNCYMPSLADLDQDGQPEVIEGTAILDGKTGAVKSKPGMTNVVAVSDIDGDGKLDLASVSQLKKSDGTALADTGVPGSWNAVGDLDKDGVPEIIGANPSLHTVAIWHYDPAAPDKYKMIRPALSINTPFDPSGCGTPPNPDVGYPGGGPPTVADFNGDGFPDIALAGGLGYVILDGKKVMDTSIPDAQTFLWSKDTQDCSSAATGSSIFDFNGDGKAEVLYGDEIQFRIYDGPTGDVLYETCNTSGTLIEFPIVADVDGDDQADIVVASNAYAFNCNGTKTAGIRVFGSKNNDWVRTRRIWNQHAYHVTNVNDDGSIPKVELPNWKQPGLNNFRQNKQPGGEFAAPDAVVTVRPSCDIKDGIIAEVRNVGQSALPAGAVVTLYKGDAPGEKLAEKSTTQVLYPGQAELLIFEISDPEVQSGKKKVFAVITDKDGLECRANNNSSPQTLGTCTGQIQ